MTNQTCLYWDNRQFTLLFTPFPKKYMCFTCRFILTFRPWNIATLHRSVSNMKLLACSDIHNNVEAVRRLRAQEDNAFDAVLVTGDMGSESAGEILNILDTFGCPVYFVYGNWDNRLVIFRWIGSIVNKSISMASI
jgi:hypothetical protein